MLNWRRSIIEFHDEYISGNSIPAHRKSLTRYHSLPAERRQREHAKRLSQLLRHAAQQVPYYRDRLGKIGVVRGDKVDLTRFREIPVLTRSILREEFEQLKSDDLARRSWYKNSSGGSTGEPVSLLQDRDHERVGIAQTEMHYAWAGRRVGEPMIKLWGSERDVLLGTIGWRNKVSGFVRNQKFLNSFKMKEEQMVRYLRDIQRLRPVIIEAYAESIYELARFMNASNIKVSGVRNVITSAGTLYPFIRDEIERAFGCPTLNRYGSREVGGIAGERAAGKGLEVFGYCNWVEIINEKGEPCKEGEEGEVLVTCLSNYAMPIIRYNIGDTAVVGTSTSSPTPSVEVLHTVTGRMMDAFVRSDGSTVPGYFFVHFLGVVHEAGWLKKAQIIQQDYDDILIKMVPVSTPARSTLDEIRDSLQRVIGPTCKVNFQFVDELPALASGKYRYTMSLVARP